jgi:GTP-binding protein HflX
MFIEASYDEKTNVYIPPKEILINDTIWFIRELPPKLIDAFKSTLEDSIESDLLVHVIDSSDPKVDIKINVVDDILKSIWANQKKIYVFNKIDGLENKEYIDKIEEYIDWEKQIKEVKYKDKMEYLKQKYADKNPIFISAGKKIWIEELKKRIVEKL